MSSEQKTTEEKQPTHDEIIAAMEKHNAEVRAKNENPSRSVQVGNTVVADVSYSDQFATKVNDLYLKKCVEAARKDEQMIRIRGKEKKFNYHALYQSEKAELAKVEERRAKSIVDTATYIMLKQKGADVENLNDVDMDYKFAQAHLFLIDPETNEGMTRQDFDGTEPEQLNPILEGYGIRTEKPLPDPFEATK